MFDPAKNFNARLTDAVDLVIDFATLGEYGLEPLEPVGRTRQGCADFPSSTRATARSAQCDLLRESGLIRPTSARVSELQALRKHRDIRAAGAPRKERRRPAAQRPSASTEIKQLSLALDAAQIKITRTPRPKQSSAPTPALRP